MRWRIFLIYETLLLYGTISSSDLIYAYGIDSLHPGDNHHKCLSLNKVPPPWPNKYACIKLLVDCLEICQQGCLTRHAVTPNRANNDWCHKTRASIRMNGRKTYACILHTPDVRTRFCSDESGLCIFFKHLHCKYTIDNYAKNFSRRFQEIQNKKHVHEEMNSALVLWQQRVSLSILKERGVPSISPISV